MHEAEDYRDRRAHERIPLDLKALVSGGTAAPHRCEVRDFCPGGMYLVPGDGNTRVAPGQRVEIHFSLHEGGAVTGKRRAFRLQAKVAHVRGHGFGVAFLNPEPTAVQALQDLTRRHQGGAAPAGSAHTPARRAEILGRFRTLVGERLPPLVEGFFHRIGEALVAQANWAKSNTEEARYFDTVTQLRKQREAIVGAYGNLLTEQIIELAEPSPTPGSSLEGTGPGGLSLVDEREFEDWVAMASLITRAEVDHRLPLYEIEQRLTDVVGVSVDKENNPVGPAVLCRSFRDALEGVTTNVPVREVIYRVFAEEVLAHLTPFYEELNRLLTEAGARLAPEKPPAPAPRPGPQASPTPTSPASASGAPATTPSASTSPVPRPPPAGEAAPLQEAIYQVFSESVRDRLGEIYGELEQVLAHAPPGGASASGARESLNRIFSESMVGLMDDFHGQLRQLMTGAPAAPPAAAPPATRATPPAQPAADAYNAARELLRLRRGLQQAPEPSATSYTLAEIQAAADNLSLPPGASLRDVLLEKLAGHPVGGRGREMAPQESDAVEALQVVFDAIRADAVLDDRVKAELARLDQPLLELALRDDTFLNSPAHPARQALDQLYRLGVAASEGGAGSDAGLGRALSQMVERISAGAREDGRVFEESLAPLSELTEHQQKAYEQRVSRVVKECEGRQRSEQALRATNDALDERLGGRRVPAVVPELLDAGWRALLRLTFTREGAQSDTWNRYVDILDRLLALLEAREQPDWQPAPEAAEVVAEVAHGLGEVCFDQYRCNKVVEELQALLVPPADAPAPNAMEMVQMPPPADESAELEHLRGPWLEQARRLHPGEWLYLQAEDGEAKPLRLIWKGEADREFVFVDRRGVKAASRTLAELVEDLRSGVATVIGDRDLPLMDRTMQEMVQQMSHQLIFQATHDLLTGLLNRKEFTKRLDHALSTARLEHTQHMLLHLDLDQFSVVNMTAGHAAGDALLQAVAELLRNCLPEEALLGRLGDDEFGILQLNSTPEAGHQLASELRQALLDYHFNVKGKRHPLGASVGLVPVGEQSPSVAELLLNAGAACDSARTAGGNRTQLYRPNDTELQHRKGVMQWLTRINHALDHDQLVLRCQQIAPLTAGAQRHYEILISYQDEEGRLAAPAEFIEAAELYNRMADVDRWVVRKVFQWMVAHRNRLDQFGSFAINLSGNSVNDADFLAFVLAELEATQVPTDRICFEITETATIANLSSAAVFMGRLKEAGCRFSLDDFGSGLSSYAYLKNLPVDYLKIDGAFIRDIVNNPSDFAVVKSINEIAHFMGMKTIAEYAENGAIIERLKEIGVDFAQGYGVERPLLLAAY